MKFLLFVQPKDSSREKWDGSVVGEEAAVDYFKANEVSISSCFISSNPDPLVIS